jgi:hypothetical protein
MTRPKTLPGDPSQISDKSQGADLSPPNYLLNLYRRPSTYL